MTAPSGSLPFGIAAFMAALFPLELGADKFVDHTAIFARRIGVPETTVALLTAGGEWEELAVVVAALGHGRSSLALGNVVGSAIANILGAFSLGIMFVAEDAEFDRSSKIYSLALLGLTTLVCPAIFLYNKTSWLVIGIVLIVLFAAYALIVAAAIGRGILTAPQDSESDTSGESSDDDEDGDATSSSSLLPVGRAARDSRARHTLWFHAGDLLFGLLSMVLAGYVLSQSATIIVDSTGLSDVVFGVVILSIATTLPEKFVAVMSGTRGHYGVLVANTAGSNIFLLSLCLGVVMIKARDGLDELNVNGPELLVLWASTLALALLIVAGARFSRWTAVAMITGYVVFIVTEFSVIHDEFRLETDN